MKELPKTTAKTSIEIWLFCPHCDVYQDRFDDLHEHLDDGEPRAENCEVELKCEACKKSFIVKEIHF